MRANLLNILRHIDLSCSYDLVKGDYLNKASYVIWGYLDRGKENIRDCCNKCSIQFKKISYIWSLRY